VVVVVLDRPAGRPVSRERAMDGCPCCSPAAAAGLSSLAPQSSHMAAGHDREPAGPPGTQARPVATCTRLYRRAAGVRE
jgi:hypothetical protein